MLFNISILDCMEKKLFLFLMLFFSLVFTDFIIAVPTPSPPNRPLSIDKSGNVSPIVPLFFDKRINFNSTSVTSYTANFTGLPLTLDISQAYQEGTLDSDITITGFDKKDLRAGIASSPKDYIWSSYRDRIFGNKNGLLDLPDST